MRLAKCSAILLSCLPCAVFALPQDIPSQHSNNTKIDVTTYIAGSYNYLQRSNYFTSGVLDRVNDLAENGVRLQQLFFSAGYLPDYGLGAHLEMTAGLDAYSVAPVGWNADMLNLQNVGFAVPDAYLYYGSGDYRLLAGVMEALAGFETYDYLSDANFSRGIIYGYVVPGVHVGLRGRKKLNDQMEFLIGTTNGWSSIRQATQIRGVEVALTHEFTNFSGVINANMGKQYMTDLLLSGPTSFRAIIDWYATYIFTKSFSINWELDYAFQNTAALPYGEIGRATWTAAAGFVNYKFNDKWHATVRGEIMNDSNGYRTGVPQCWKEVTLSLGYNPIRPLSLTLETRHDFSNVNAFANRQGGNSNNNQQSYSLEALYLFV